MAKTYARIEDYFGDSTRVITDLEDENCVVVGDEWFDADGAQKLVKALDEFIGDVERRKADALQLELALAKKEACA